MIQNRLVAQLLVTVLAAISLAVVGVLLVTDAIHNAESAIAAEGRNSIAEALRDLRRGQPAYATTQRTLKTYSGVEGGFYRANQFLGYAYPSHDTGGPKTDVPQAERGLIAVLAQSSLTSDQPVYQVLDGKLDMLVMGAVGTGDRATAAWAMKRIRKPDTATRKQEALLAALISVALASIVVALATGIGLKRGVAQITSGLLILESDFDFRLPERRDELGRISQSINRMAAARKRLEADLRREDRLRALGRLAAGLAHEIRNPLNSIRLTVQLLESRLDSGRVQRQDLRLVQAEVDRLNTLLNDLLDLQRSRPPAPEWQRVLPVVRHCMELLQREAGVKGVRMLLEEAAENVRAFFDARQFTQTLMNLLLNALEAAKPEGTVTIRITEESGAAQVEVQDDGPGLARDQEEHLFEPFYTSKAAGTGLGLAVSRELMRGQGGDVVYGGSRQGARFVVQLAR